jgi:thioredoxin 1
MTIETEEIKMEYTFNENNFDKMVLNSDKPVLVDVFALWCGPCQMLAPIIAEISKEYDGKVNVGKVNSDENPNIALKYGIKFLPTVLLFKGGEVVKSFIGLCEKNEITAAIDEVL